MTMCSFSVLCNTQDKTPPGISFRPEFLQHLGHTQRKSVAWKKLDKIVVKLCCSVFALSLLLSKLAGKLVREGVLSQVSYGMAICSCRMYDVILGFVELQLSVAFCCGGGRKGPPA